MFFSSNDKIRSAINQIYETGGSSILGASDWDYLVKLVNVCVSNI